MKMMKALFPLLFVALALPAVAQQHWDGGPTWVTNDTTLWFNIIGDHGAEGDGFCDNTSSTGQGYPDIDCEQWNNNQNAPIQSASQDCGSGYCEVSATVRCRFLNAASDHWITFTCSGSAQSGVRTGYLGGSKKGVRCGNVECGCELACLPPGSPLVCMNNVCTNCPAQFFGNPQIVGGNPANRVCG